MWQGDYRPLQADPGTSRFLPRMFSAAAAGGYGLNLKQAG